MLHPKYKLAYFKEAAWEPEWIDTAVDILRDEWETHYKPTIDLSFLQTPQQSNVDSVCLFHVHCLQFLILSFLASQWTVF